jgi:hypothetical protein
MMRNPSHPGEIIREMYLTPLNLNVTQAAKDLGVTRKTLSDILNDTAGFRPKRRYGFLRHCSFRSWDDGSRGLLCRRINNAYFAEIFFIESSIPRQ